MKCVRKCGNCKKRVFFGFMGMTECCWGYEMTSTEDEEIEMAADCGNYEEGKPECLEDDEYCPSSTNGDYGPGNPWDAPGMSIKDFI